MPFEVEYSEHLIKKLKRIQKKNPGQYTIIHKKCTEVQTNPLRYKNLRYDQKGRRRVHIDKHFVLVFKVNVNQNLLRFLDYDHHDRIYKKSNL